jgi:hypothetical protein
MKWFIRYEADCRVKPRKNITIEASSKEAAIEKFERIKWKYRKVKFVDCVRLKEN